MTIGELKAFIEGMGIPEGNCPTVEQWERIKEKLAQVQASTAPVDWQKMPSPPFEGYRRPYVSFSGRTEDEISSAAKVAS